MIRHQNVLFFKRHECKRTRVSRACAPCIVSKMRCDEGRPCRRCSLRNIKDECVDRRRLPHRHRKSLSVNTRLRGGLKACVNCTRLKIACNGDRPCSRCISLGVHCVDKCTVLSYSSMVPLKASKSVYNVSSTSAKSAPPIPLVVAQVFLSGYRKFSPDQISHFINQRVQVASLRAFSSIALCSCELDELHDEMMAYACKTSILADASSTVNQGASCDSTPNIRREENLSLSESECDSSSAETMTNVFEILRRIHTRALLSLDRSLNSTFVNSVSSPKKELNMQGDFASITIGFTGPNRILRSAMNEKAEKLFGLTADIFQQHFDDDFVESGSSQKLRSADVQTAPFFWRLFAPLSWPTLAQLTIDMWISTPSTAINAKMDLVRSNGRVFRADTLWQTVFERTTGAFKAIVMSVRPDCGRRLEAEKCCSRVDTKSIFDQQDDSTSSSKT